MTASRLPLSLDWLVHQPTRLGLMTMLGHHPCSFTTIRKELGINQGLVNKHTQYLEVVGYITRHIESTTGKLHRSTFTLTADGSKALHDYYATVAQILDAAPEGFR